MTGSRLTPPLRFAAAALLAAAAILAGSCLPEPKPAAPPPRPNFVLVIADTLRADHLHFAGYGKADSPDLDALRSKSTNFPNAYSTSSWTLPATVSLFLSQLPSQHGVVTWGSTLTDEQTTLAEMLHDAGYRTGAWTANLLLPEERGMNQGFDDYELVTHPKWVRGAPFQGEHSFALADDLSSKAIAWLEETSASDDGAPFFVYLHYMEPHTPFLCPPTAGDDCRRAATVLNRRLAQVKWGFTDYESRLIKNLYDTDVKRMDESLGRLYRDLEEKGFLENTWLIVTADHGEMLGEHGLWVHGRALYRETVRIPLLVCGPSRNASVVNSPVSLIDIAPTILDLAGIDAPASFRGLSLRGALGGGSLPLRPVAAELFPVHKKPIRMHRHLLSITRGDTKLVVGVDGKLVRFDLATDPGEQEPLSADWGELEKLLSEAGIEFDRTKLLSRGVPELKPEILENLRSLGYVQ